MSSAPTYVDVLLEVQNIVSTSEDYIPLTGVYALDEELTGWQWDKRLLEDNELARTRYNTYVGGHIAGLKDGTKIDYWQSGSVSNTEFIDIKEHPTSDSLTWTPRVNRGVYSVYWNERTLFSDRATSERVDPLLNENGVMIHKVRSDCLLSTIKVVLLNRDEYLIRRPYYDLEYVTEFTGKLENNNESRASTVDSNGDVIWANLSDRKREYTIIEKDGDNYIYTNQDCTIDVGFSGELSAENIEKFLEDKYEGNSEGRDLYLNYYPLVNDSVDVYAVTPGGTVAKLKEETTLNFIDSTVQAYSVDYDLGIIRLGGYQAPDLYLSTAVVLDDTEIECYVEDDIFMSYPGQGVITIGSEQILYYSKGRRTFYDCVRGYNNTTAGTYEVGTAVSDIQHGAGTASSDTIYVSYQATPRVEYEVTDYEIRTANKTGHLNVKAIKNVETNNVIQISPVDSHLAKVTLEVDDIGSIGGGIYGPIRYGTDVAKLTATAYDSMDNPVEDIELTIVLDSVVGALNSTLSSYTALSNSAGQIYALYNAPYNWASVLKDVYKVAHTTTGDTVFNLSEDIPPGVKADDITIFQVLKHDKILGTKGSEFDIIAAENLPEVLAPDGDVDVIGQSAITIDGFVHDADSIYSGGTAYIVCDDGIVYTREIVHVLPNYLPPIDTSDDWPRGSTEHSSVPATGEDVALLTGIENYTLTLGGTVESFDTSTIVNARCWLIERDAQEWNSDFLDGVRVLLYEWSLEAVHPLTGKEGAYTPVRPDQISSDRLVFEDRELSIPDATDRDVNLGGYMVVTSDIVSFYAYGKDPVSGRVITSDTLRVQLDLPAHLRGVDDSGTLPIPYGFTFVTEEHNVGTGLGGANFLTVNPKGDGISTFNIRFDIGT